MTADTTRPEASTAAADVLAFPTSPERRLRVALRQLDQALAEQREAVAAFRTQITALRGAMAGLGESAITLQENLGEAAREAEKAQAAAARLKATADAMPG
jgi:DNA-binding FrmR family transcriptional regulator